LLPLCVQLRVASAWQPPSAPPLVTGWLPLSSLLTRLIQQRCSISVRSYRRIGLTPVRLTASAYHRRATLVTIVHRSVLLMRSKLSRIRQEDVVTNMLIRSGVAVLLSCGLVASPALAGAKKHTPEHNAAVKKCVEAYEAAAKAAHSPNSPTGAARHRAMHAAGEAKKACIAKAPK
jgi:hypothetical protein